MINMLGCMSLPKRVMVVKKIIRGQEIKKINTL
jgi:hypothetical protein